MIRINLLPIEKRRAERTPLPRFMLILACTGMGMILVMYILFLAVIKIPGKREDKRSLEAQLQQLSRASRDHQKLMVRITQLTSRLNQAKQVTERPLEFWRAMDAIWEVTDANRRIWLDSVQFLNAREAGQRLKRLEPQTKDVLPYAIEIKAHSAGHDPRDITRFRLGLLAHRDLKKKFDEVFYAPGWKVEEEDEEAFEEREYMTFTEFLYPVKNPSTATSGGSK